MFSGIVQRLGPVALLALATSALAAPVATAAPATEEYTLELPGIENPPSPRSGGEEAIPLGNAGILGEDAEPVTPLGAIAGTVAGPLGLLILGPVALLGLFAVTGRRKKRRGL
jgi:hypothetical protein